MKFKFFLTLAVLFGLCAPSFADDNIVIVFDTSGSMGEYMRTAKKTRIAVAQDALVSVLSKVPDTTKVGILTFGGWIYDLQKVDRAKIEEAIRGTRPGGGTHLYSYIKQGADRLLQERQKQGNVGYYKLLVVTDGEAQDANLNGDGEWNDGTFKPGVLKDIINRSIVVDTIALEMRNDHALKNQINGTYMRGDDPSSIEQSLKKAVAEVGFNGKDDVSEAAFKEIGELPDNFVKASISGLTTYQNHPIGEKAPIRVVKDGVIVEVPDTDGAAQAAGVGGGGGGWGWWLFGGLGVVVLIIIIIATSNRR